MTRDADHAAFHLLPHPLLAGALVAVPLGLVSAASSWTEVCTRCERPLEVCHGRLSPEERATLRVQLAQPELLSIAYAQRMETGELRASGALTGSAVIARNAVSDDCL